jgi:nitroimidazol reductase NimA-like FMN-containing flavoprotein (pyridoxamine 5'-phosphate oxidase superfamily)
MDNTPRRLTELTRAQAMRLLASVPLGRIVFTHHALPAIRPVNHVIDGDDIIIRSHPGAAIISAADNSAGVIVAYEADAIAPATRTGWSVIVTGTARLIRDPADAARYEPMLQPWVAGDMSQLIRIQGGIVTGYSLAPAPGT